MEDRRFVYLIGIIKWVNLMTIFILMSNFFISIGITPVVAVVIQLFFVAIISIFLNKWFEKKFGKQNLVENTLVFKIINTLIIVCIALVLFISKQFTYLIVILVFMTMFSLVLLLINKGKKQGKGRSV